MRLNLNGRGVLGCWRWYLIKVIRGSFFGLPLCFARFAGVVQKARVFDTREVEELESRDELEVRERDRKD
jgi:hypothetical protein